MYGWKLRSIRFIDREIDGVKGVNCRMIWSNGLEDVYIDNFVAHKVRTEWRLWRRSDVGWKVDDRKFMTVKSALEQVARGAR